MYAAVGALSEATKQSMTAALPPCFSEHFYNCWQEGRENDPGCAMYAPVNAAYKEDPTLTQSIVDQVPYCDYAKRDLWIYAGLAGSGGFIIGMMLASAL